MSGDVNIIDLENQAGLVVKFHLAYKENGQDKSIQTGDMTVGQKRTERFPRSVTSITVTPSFYGLSWEALPEVTITKFDTAFKFTGTVWNPDVEVMPDPYASSTPSGTQQQSAPRKPNTYELLLQNAQKGTLKDKLSKNTMAEFMKKLQARSNEEVIAKLLDKKGPPSPKQLHDLLGHDLAAKIKDELKA